MASDTAQATLSTTWDVLGPFPIHAREQHLLSPSFPLDLTKGTLIDFDAAYPSSYADNGSVSWSTTPMAPDGAIQVSFPEIRWQSLRATEGWAALQHHALLHGTIAIPEHATQHRLRVQLVQGAYFTVLPRGAVGAVQRWYAGNIYDLPASQPQSVPVEPGEYDIWVAGDYEIRLFGDPAGGPPVQSLRLTVALESVAEPSVEAVATHAVYPDFLDGLAFGGAIGLGVRSVAGRWTIADVSLASEVPGFTVGLVLPDARIAPSQTRIVPLRIKQSAPLPSHLQSLEISLTLRHDNEHSRPKPLEEEHAQTTLKFSIPVTSAGKYIKATYLYSGTMPTAFHAIPPASGDLRLREPVLLALHGAGVDIFASTSWQDALPRVEGHWYVVPSGRTAWVSLGLTESRESFITISSDPPGLRRIFCSGLDWHGASALDAWRAVDALAAILRTRAAPTAALALTTPTQPTALLLGHSNGGQGAWHLAARAPDRVAGVVAAAGYVKSQAYVPWAMGRGAHFADPALNGILDAAFAPDDNDLFLANLVDTPVYAIHGGADENVPVWHTRELVSTLRTLSPEADVTYREDPGQPHWYPDVLDNAPVRAFLARVLGSAARPASPRFTLTVASPRESGALHGWAVEALAVPGRLARLHVAAGAGAEAGAGAGAGAEAVEVRTVNVGVFSVERARWGELREVWVDGERVEVGRVSAVAEGAAARVIFGRDAQTRKWADQDRLDERRCSRVQSILSTEHGPIKLSVPHRRLGEDTPELDLAVRIAHDLDTYHKLDAEIVFGPVQEGENNVVTIQVGELPKQTEGSASDGLGGHYRIDKPGTGVIALEPRARGAGLRLHAVDVAGLERLGRLFPIRTGVKVPDWLVAGPDMDARSSGGILGAGFFGADGKWNEAMCYLPE
ncbi:hypothetical protein HDZ31DRAFT_32988 [Schizophyllum fasciatum]